MPLNQRHESIGEEFHKSIKRVAPKNVFLFIK